MWSRAAVRAAMQPDRKAGRWGHLEDNQAAQVIGQALEVPHRQGRFRCENCLPSPLPPSGSKPPAHPLHFTVTGDAALRDIRHFIDGPAGRGQVRRFGGRVQPQHRRGPGPRGRWPPRPRWTRAVEVGADRLRRLAGGEPAAPRARRMFEFKRLVEARGERAGRTARRPEHGKVIADAPRRRTARPRRHRIRPAASPHALKKANTPLHWRRPGHRRLFDASAAGRGRRHNAVQLPRHDPDVDVQHGHRGRQHLRPEAVRARSVGARAPRAN